MIVVEGPDNSGKSTLIDWMIKSLPVHLIKHDRHGPPSGAWEIKTRTEIILQKAISSPYKKGTVVDRFSLIGESIYGPILRGKDLWTEIPRDKIRFEQVFNNLDPFIIYCRPDKSTILDMSHHQLKDYDTKEHVCNVTKNQELIIQAYDNYFARMAPHRFYKYNYELGDEALVKLKQILGEYLKW